VSKMKVHFSSKSDDWATPQWLFDELNKEFGPLTVDVCATRENHKCPAFYSLGAGQDGLTVPWHQAFGWPPKCWMNPPYGREIGKWVRKAYEEAQKGCLVVALLPARVDTRWFHDWIYRRPNTDVVFLRGRLKFGDAKNSAPFPSMVVVFHPPQEVK